VTPVGVVVAEDADTLLGADGAGEPRYGFAAVQHRVGRGQVREARLEEALALRGIEQAARREDAGGGARQRQRPREIDRLVARVGRHAQHRGARFKRSRPRKSIGGGARPVPGRVGAAIVLSARHRASPAPSHTRVSAAGCRLQEQIGHLGFPRVSLDLERRKPHSDHASREQVVQGARAQARPHRSR
jgi:hypothetical protein